jgi:hypothetical protein
MNKLVIILLISAVLFPVPTNAVSFKIGNVKKTYQTEVCKILTQGGQLLLLYSPYDNGVTAWVNINGNDLKLIRKNRKTIKRGKSSTVEYFNQGTRVVVESKYLHRDENGMFSQSIDKVIFVRNSESKTIQGKGFCDF